nr:hypothetical protein [Polaromonas sp.]
MTYRITLQDFPEIPDDARAKAEEQYRRALEKALGGPQEVVLAYRAWLSVSESGNDQVSKEDVAQATQCTSTSQPSQFWFNPPELVIASNELAYAVEDGFPVTKGHALVILQRHVVDFIDLSDEELAYVLWSAIQTAVQPRPWHQTAFNFSMETFRMLHRCERPWLERTGCSASSQTRAAPLQVSRMQMRSALAKALPTSPSKPESGIWSIHRQASSAKVELAFTISTASSRSRPIFAA